SLPLRQRILLEKAQSKYDIFSDLAKEQTQTKLSAIEKEYAIQVAKSSYGYNLKGAWEIAGGLGMTADHKVSIQRIVEGIPKEVGEVSLRDGTYNIHVDALYGNLIAKMMDPSGKVLGEGQFKLEQDLVTAEKAPK